ncbi:MAG: VPLPA-CTERM sorting domain-containing protein [Gammaproteobacteria bacterium]
MIKKNVRKQTLASCSALMLMAGSAGAQAVTLLSETFDSASGPFPSVSCGSGCYHAVDVGTAVTSSSVFGSPTNGLGSSDYAAGADNDWYSAVFEQDDNGYVTSDVGIQATGGNGNNTRVGLAKDDSGMLISFDATGMQNVTLSFDWRTFVANSGDKLVAGYFVGDLTAGKTNDFNEYREINLSPTGNASSAAGGAENGNWNWNPVNGGNTGEWIELLRGEHSNSWDSVSFDLDLAADQSEVWIAFWLDNGNHDIGKFDNVLVTADPIPVPATVWLFGSGLVGLIGVARRRVS